MVDAGEFRDAQRQQWNTAAPGWLKWVEQTEAATQVVSDRIVEMAGVEPGARVLDIACGMGQPSLSAARKAGDGGSVVGTDISAEMISIARRRAADLGLDNVEFVESPAVELDYAEGSFDAAVSRWGIIFEPDGEGVASRVRGFLKPGGRFAISAWSEPERVPMLSIPMRTVMERLDVTPPPPGTPGPLSRPTPEAIRGLLEGGGFSDIEVEEVEISNEWDSPEDFTTFVREIAPPISALMANQPPDVQEATWQAITDAVRDQAGGDGPVRQTNFSRVASGRA
jgi:SAM-dependent methyltransferase